MARTNLSPEEYDELKRFLGYYATHHFKTAALAGSENHPMAKLAALEKTSPKHAMQGLMQTVNDVIEHVSVWTPEKIRDVDTELRKLGIVTIAELQQRYSRDYARIVKRGFIKNTAEYYLLKGVLDGGSLDVDPAEQMQVG